ETTSALSLFIIKILGYLSTVISKSGLAFLTLANCSSLNNWNHVSSLYLAPTKSLVRLKAKNELTSLMVKLGIGNCSLARFSLSFVCFLFQASKLAFFVQ